MSSNKIIRSICYFASNPSEEIISNVIKIEEKLTNKGYEIQTKRICSSNFAVIKSLDEKFADDYIFGLGTISQEKRKEGLNYLFNSKNVHFNIDLTDRKIDLNDADFYFEIIKNKPDKTFNFTYVFNNNPSSPFFPSATYSQKGFSIGLQPTDLSENCTTLEEWLEKMKTNWQEINGLFNSDSNYLGIDSSTAPLVTTKGSLINFINKLGYDFSHSVTTDLYLKITEFIKVKNPKAVGLCGLMFPCLEDLELANEYDKGNFSIERNLYLSLHSGLGIDTYPIGIDEKPERILEILKLIQGLSNKYKKSLSCRFVSDGKARIGDKTDFKNQYLKDVTIRPL